MSGNKNPFKKADVGYDQEWEIHGDFSGSQGRDGEEETFSSALSPFLFRALENGTPSVLQTFALKGKSTAPRLCVFGVALGSDFSPGSSIFSAI